VSAAAAAVSAALRDAGLGPFFGTPCGILGPLYAELEERDGLTTVAREDNAVGLAAGAALAGRSATVLMQNSGLGQAVNALASLVVPYEIPVLLVVSLRGTDADDTPENAVMGALTEQLLDAMDVPHRTLGRDEPAADAAWARDRLTADGGPAALLVPPALFGWTA
jgi:sulfopyruvate decarboxylase subunit alpha